MNPYAGAGKAALIAVATLSLALPASATAVTANFDDLPPGTVVSNQYANLGGPGQGVTFGPLPGAGGTGFKPRVEAPPAGEPESAPHIGDISLCDLGGPQECGEFYPPGTTGTFQSGRSAVSVRVGLEGPLTNTCAGDQTLCSTVTLQAYNASGNPIGAPDTKTVMRGAGYHTLLSVSSPASDIRGFKIRAADSNDANEQVGIDDLTFDVPMAPPPPDFTLTPASTFLVMAQGSTITDRIDIGRSGGSSGNVQFSLSGPLPDGVSASFDPNPAGGNATDLRITSNPDSGITGFNPIELNVTGTPASGATGPEPRSFPIQLQVREAFSLSVPQAPVDLAPCVVKVPVTVTRDFGFAGPVSLSVDGLANGIGASFEPAQLTFGSGGAQTSQLVVTGPSTGLAVPPTTLTVRAGAPGYADRTSTVIVGGTCPAQYDPRITSLEITQGTQSEVLPQRFTEFPASPIPYADIPGRANLRRDKPTVVRVYANLLFGPIEGVPNVPVVLYGAFRDRIGNLKAHAGSPLSPVSGVRRLFTGPLNPPASEVGSEIDVYTFVLPPEWTHTDLRISAAVQPSLGGGTRAVKPCETEACKVDDQMGISGIPFVGARSITANPLELTVNGVPQPDPSQVFRWARIMSPLDLRVLPYAARIDVTDIKQQKDACEAAGDDTRDKQCRKDANDAQGDRVNDWTCDHSVSERQWNIGVSTEIGAGKQSDHWCFSTLGTEHDAVVERRRPMSSVAHELGHLFGRVHADRDCGGDDNGQEGEDWPPDNRGFLQSVGLATEQGTGINGGPFAVMAPASKQWHDYMSYCGINRRLTDSETPVREGDHWISVRNWNRILGAFDFAKPLAPPLRAAQAPPIPSIEVSAVADEAGQVSIQSVNPRSAAPQPPSESPYRLVGLDAAGQPVAEVRMHEARDHVDGEPAATSLNGVLPAEGVASVAIVRDGVTLASRSRSANPPAVSIPRTPSFGRAASIRWQASDADGDPLLATVDYSADGGRTFRQVFAGPSSGTARVPTRLLSRSSNARVRVTVNDGFLATSATSGRFRSAGAPPSVAILTPESGLRQPNDAPLFLFGQAFDDRPVALTGRRLRWAIGRRTLGTGEQISPARLPAGRHRVDLIARDRSGRTARDSVIVNLTGARPLFLTLEAPASARRSTRTLRLRVASSFTATLTVSGAGGRAQRFSVNRKSRRLTLRIPRSSRRTLTLRLTLRAGKQTSTRVLTVRRS